jgi:hypothetical protein
VVGYDFWKRALVASTRDGTLFAVAPLVSVMPSTRSPILVLAGLLVVAFVPLLVMWVAVGGTELLGYFVGFALYFLVFHVALPVKVFVDARPYGRDRAMLWTAAAFFVPLVGAALYFLVGRPMHRDAEAA